MYCQTIGGRDGSCCVVAKVMRYQHPWRSTKRSYCVRSLLLRLSRQQFDPRRRVPNDVNQQGDAEEKDAAGDDRFEVGGVGHRAWSTGAEPEAPYSL